MIKNVTFIPIERWNVDNLIETSFSVFSNEYFFLLFRNGPTHRHTINPFTFSVKLLIHWIQIFRLRKLFYFHSEVNAIFWMAFENATSLNWSLQSKNIICIQSVVTKIYSQISHNQVLLFENMICNLQNE